MTREKREWVSLSGYTQDQCEKTFVTLTVMDPKLKPDQVTNKLGIKPTSSWLLGESRKSPKGDKIYAPYKTGGWIFSTQKVCKSRDTRKHIALLLKKLTGKEQYFRSLVNAGMDAQLMVYWSSAEGHGGPWFEPDHMAKLGQLGVRVVLDVYF